MNFTNNNSHDITNINNNFLQDNIYLMLNIYLSSFNKDNYRISNNSNINYSTDAKNLVKNAINAISIYENDLININPFALARYTDVEKKLLNFSFVNPYLILFNFDIINNSDQTTLDHYIYQEIFINYLDNNYNEFKKTIIDNLTLNNIFNPINNITTSLDKLNPNKNYNELKSSFNEDVSFNKIPPEILAQSIFNILSTILFNVDKTQLIKSIYSKFNPDNYPNFDKLKTILTNDFDKITKAINSFSANAYNIDAISYRSNNIVDKITSYNNLSYIKPNELFLFIDTFDLPIDQLSFTKTVFIENEFNKKIKSIINYPISNYQNNMEFTIELLNRNTPIDNIDNLISKFSINNNKDNRNYINFITAANKNYQTNLENNIHLIFRSLFLDEFVNTFNNLNLFNDNIISTAVNLCYDQRKNKDFIPNDQLIEESKIISNDNFILKLLSMQSFEKPNIHILESFSLLSFFKNKDIMNNFLNILELNPNDNSSTYSAEDITNFQIQAHSLLLFVLNHPKTNNFKEIINYSYKDDFSNDSPLNRIKNFLKSNQLNPQKCFDNLTYNFNLLAGNNDSKFNDLFKHSSFISLHNGQKINSLLDYKPNYFRNFWANSFFNLNDFNDIFNYIDHTNPTKIENFFNVKTIINKVSKNQNTEKMPIFNASFEKILIKSKININSIKEHNDDDDDIDINSLNKPTPKKKAFKL